MEVLGPLGVSLAGMPVFDYSLRFQGHHARLLCLLAFVEHVLHL